MSGQVDREPVRSIKVGIPNRDDLEGLSLKLGDCWQAVARRLRVPDEQIDSLDHQHQRLPEKGYAVLRFWKQTFGSDATYQTLYDALSHEFVNRQDLAEEFCLTGASDAVMNTFGTTEDAGRSSGVSAPLSPTSSISGSTSDQVITCTLSIKVTPQNLDAEKHKKFKEHFKSHFALLLEENAVCPTDQSQEGPEIFFEELVSYYNLLVKTFKIGCLEITVQCHSLEDLERLWSDYLSGRLNDSAQRCLVTDELKRKLIVETLELKTTIAKESYLNCKKAFKEKSHIVTRHSYQDLSDEQQQIVHVHETFTRQIHVYTEGVAAQIAHMQDTYNLALKSVGVGSLEITFQCPSLENLERL